MSPRLLLLLALLGRTAHADEDRARAASTSTNPLPYVEKVKFEPSYTFEHDDTQYRAQLEVEPTLPFDGLLIPGLEVADVWSIARFQLFAESLQNENGTASGLENLNAVDLAAYRYCDLTVGAGIATVFPMATSSALGPAKWQVGPAVGFHYEPSHLFQIAALAQALWSVAGSSEVSNQSYVTLQPFVTLHLADGLLVTSDATMSFFWRGGSTTIPVDLGVGYAFSKKFVGAIKGTLTVAGHDQGMLSAALDLTFLP